MAYTPAIQATLFNAVMKQVPFTKSELLISKTKYLHQSLNSQEQMSMYGHGSLKVASYMYLVDFWREYSLAQVFNERGTSVSDEVLKKYNIDISLFKLPMKFFGPTNFSVSDQCSVSANQAFTYSYLDLLKEITKLQPLVNAVKNNDSLQASMFYLKAYYYQRLQLANTTHTYTNDNCLSDINGLLTCATDYVDIKAFGDERLNRMKRYQELEWNNFELSRRNRERLSTCPLTVWSYFNSAGGLEPLSDGASVSASEALSFNVSGGVLTRAKDVSINAIMKENKDILAYFYKNEDEKGNPVDIEYKTKVLSAVVLTQMQTAVYRTTNYLNGVDI